MSELNEPPRLNPAQQQITDQLGATFEERPRFRDDLGEYLRHELEVELAPLLAEVEGETLFVSKHDLTSVHGCEARFVAERDVEFAWSVPLARGSVAHKAIELLVTWRGEPQPLDLVEHALARLQHQERSVGVFIQSLDEAERAELAGSANDLVAAFLETFPPLRRRWRPVAESRVRADLCRNTVALSGRIDLSLGRADGNVAGKVVIDLKTGRPRPAHREDLRFYALLEAMKIGIPPRLLVSYYLDSGTPEIEEVSEDVLDAAARRLVDGVGRIVALKDLSADQATTSPGGGCRFCPLATVCDDGKRHLAGDDDGIPAPVEESADDEPVARYRPDLLA